MTDPKAIPDVLHVDGPTRDAIIEALREPQDGMAEPRRYTCEGRTADAVSDIVRAYEAERDALAARVEVVTSERDHWEGAANTAQGVVEALEAQRDEALKALDDSEQTWHGSAARARRILSGDGGSA